MPVLLTEAKSLVGGPPGPQKHGLPALDDDSGQAPQPFLVADLMALVPCAVYEH